MDNILTIQRYAPQQQAAWDAFVTESINGTFLFLRDYMDYHADRFEDCSLIICKGSKPIALLPANRQGCLLNSHGGLTYGGFIIGKELTTASMLEIFETTLNYLRNESITQWIYKCVPYIYQRYPHAGDRYALYKFGAEQIACNLSSTIELSCRPRFAELRRRGIKRAEKNDISICESADYSAFWNILSGTLQDKYGVKPVHSLQEIELLHARFPEQIKLYAALSGHAMLAGCVVYDCGTVAHAQYISASPEGKKSGALDLLFAHLIETTYASHRYFDFGISTENNGCYLNSGLLAQKEGFGGRGVTYDIYRINV